MLDMFTMYWWENLGWWSTFSSPITWVLIVGVAAIIAVIVFVVVKAKKNKGSGAK